ncbi:hypothetical protein FGL86_05730 [Pistricoccus aurantiacus]|uniref:DUF7673 domain-containing protein n=1 Tax=Pistricoccus aurantiacus TaxID=1883414 RepID=A0A5B8SRQ2_9GAMM|nr:hypothetical protein [Pistricoccus aurantiacus]QEA38627.1 hypothetical protein FGL86_05730 [Pistricoccus aurantiacus]
MKDLSIRLAELAAQRESKDEGFAQRLESLNRLVEVAQNHSGQSHHCRRILLAVYNSDEWPLDLTRLRCLDADLQRAALGVIEWAVYTSRELHEYLPEGDAIMKRFWAIERE